MFSVKYLVIFLACVNFNVLCLSVPKKPCSYDDEECLTKSTRAIYHKIVAGRPGEVEASDPLRLDLINLDTPELKHKMVKATLFGLQKCDVEDVLVNAKEAFFNYQIACPDLRIESTYEIDGKIDGVTVNGAGASVISYKNYEILLKGYYGKYLDESGDLHTNITKFNVVLSTEEVTREYSGISFSDKDEEAEASTVEGKLAKLEEEIRHPVMNRFMEKYIQNLNKFLVIVPVKDIHYHV
ncbi:uncharacterized protein LOC142976108 [Anticarsia gemmatalis]|uniref:uncharacterized protein LOC142976108 n=1 Tax=Anticarsia gemmatalis TaxID=129554 RepID=UPI003F7620F1